VKAFHSAFPLHGMVRYSFVGAIHTFCD